MLETERKFYSEHVAEWEKEYPDKFVVIKGTELIGAYTTMEEALVAGAERFGLESYLVRRVGGGEEQITIPALTLGLLHAGSQHSA